MNLVNLSAEPPGVLHSWIPHSLKAEQIVFLPDACPGKSPLPTGTAVLTKQSDWRRFAISDCGCGMRLLKSSVIPSHMTGDVAVVRATQRVSDILFSMSHGTGRKLSRGDCKPLAEAFDFKTLRRYVLIPEGIEDASLRTEGPYAYRDLDDCLSLIGDFVEETGQFGVIAYMGHL